MKWLSLDESVYLCICLLTVACSREMQNLFYYYWLFVVGRKKISGSGRVLALNLTVPLGSGQTILGTGWVRASILSLCRRLHLVGPPLAFRTASILQMVVGNTRCWKHSSKMLVHIDRIASCSCCRFVGCTSMM